MAAILKVLKYETQLNFDLRYEKIVPDYGKKYFHGDDVIDDVTGWPHGRPSIIMFGRGSLREQVARTMSRQYTCEYRNGLSRFYLPKEDLNK